MAAPAKFLFDIDFAAPDKARERAATPPRSRRRSPTPRRAPTAPASRPAQREAKAESDRRAALALEEIGIAHPRHRHALLRHRSPDGNRGGRRRGRGRAQAVRRTDRRASRSARSSALVSDCFSPSGRDAASRGPHQRRALRGRARADRAAGQAKRLRGPPRDPGRARTSRPATAGSNGPTAAWCSSAPRSKPRSTNSSGATWRPATRPERP